MRAADWVKGSRGWAALVWFGACTLAAAWPAAVLQFDRAAIADGELWRVLSGHWVHWSAVHALGNGALLMALLGAARENLPWLRLWLVAAPMMSLLLFAFDPTLAQYRGSSGLVAMVAGAVWVQWLPVRPRLAWTLAALVAARLAVDFSGMGMPGVLPSGVITAWPVHAFGLLAGAAVAGWAAHAGDNRRHEMLA